LILETIEEEAKYTNEDLRMVQNKCFCVLNDIQRNRDDQIKLEDHMEEMRDRHKKAHDAFDIIVN